MHKSSRLYDTTFLAAAAIVLALSAPSTPAQTLLTYYNFEDSTSGGSNAGVPNFTSDPPGLQTTTITTNFDASEIAPGFFGVEARDGTAVNTAPGNVQISNLALWLRGGQNLVNNGRYIQLTLDMAGFQQLVLSYASARGSGVGEFTTQTLSYSTDGMAFTTFGSFMPTPAFTIATFDLSSVSTINNQSSVTLRLTFTGATQGGLGPNMLDNIQLNARPIPEPTTWALALAGISVMLVYRLRARRVLNC